MLDVKKEINDYFDCFVEDLRSLIQHPSVLDTSTASTHQPFGKANRDVLDEMLNIGKRDGFVVKDVDGYAGHIDIGSGEEIIGVLGHLDVVPVNEKGWDFDPFVLTQKGNKLYGRGTSDDKGPLLYAYYAAKILHEKQLIQNKKIRIIFGCNEESGAKCMEYYFLKEPYPKLGFTPDANFPVVYGEKKLVNVTITGNIPCEELIMFESGTVSNIVPEKATAILSKSIDHYEEKFKQFLRIHSLEGNIIKEGTNTKIELFGKSSHASLPHLGQNAAVLLGCFLNDVLTHPIVQFMSEYFDEDYYAKKLGFGFIGQMGPLTCNVGIIHYCKGVLEMKLDLRCPHEIEDSYMISCFDKACQKYHLKYQIDIGEYLFVDPHSTLVECLHDAYTSCTKEVNSVPQAIGGGTYAKTMPNCVAFGPEFPGTDNQIHQNNEFLDIEEAKKAIEIYVNALYNLMTR